MMNLAAFVAAASGTSWPAQSRGRSTDDIARTLARAAAAAGTNKPIRGWCDFPTAEVASDVWFESNVAGVLLIGSDGPDSAVRLNSASPPPQLACELRGLDRFKQ